MKLKPSKNPHYWYLKNGLAFHTKNPLWGYTKEGILEAIENIKQRREWYLTEDAYQNHINHFNDGLNLFTFSS